MRQRDPMGFGVLLRRLRLATGLSQEALAERARMSAKAIGALEIGARRAPYRETVDQLVSALGATPNESAQLVALAEQARARRTRVAEPASQPGPPTNLPSPPTRLIGRAGDLATTGELLSAHRLVTLVGAGGVGKTRVALGAALEQLSRFPRGVWFVDLAPLSDPASLAEAVSTVLGVAEKSDGPAADRIARFLQGRRLLIVLDNCEHVLRAAAEFAQTMLTRCEGLTLLATSREPLRTAGEAVYEVPSLQCPPLEQHFTASGAASYSAVELFCDRARSGDATFTLTEDAAQVVGRIVRRLDGLPLAIELAATRVRALGLSVVERRLDLRFELLAGGDRIAPPRQQTMRALIEWSYDLLSPAEQLLFRRLSVFVGGCSLEAAEEVCASSAGSVVNNVASLVDKSLVTRYEHGNTYRYRFLESTRDFAREALTPDESQQIALRHATWVASSLQTVEDRIATRPTNAHRVDLNAHRVDLAPELDNIRAALAWCDANGEFVLGGRIASRIAELFYWRGLGAEGTRWVQRSLDRLDEEQHLEIVTRLCCALARQTGSANTRLSASERAVTLAERLGDASIVAQAFVRYAVALYLMGRMDEALAANAHASELLRRDPAQPNFRIAWALQHRSWILVELGRVDEARYCIEEAIAIFRQFKAEREMLSLCGDLAELEFASGNPEQALQIVDEAISAVAVGDNLECESIFICNRAGYLLSLGDISEAEGAAREAVLLAVQALYDERVLHALEHLAAALACRGDAVTAGLLAGFVQAGYAKSGYERETTERSSHEILVGALRRQLSGDEFAKIMTSGARMTRGEVLEKAMGTALPA